MIFVTIGTSEPFERLLMALRSLPTDEEMVVQRGRSQTTILGARCVDFLPPDELEQLVESARVVITHAGAGSVLVALRHGRRPIVVPRLARYGEAVDDHQLVFARKLADAGLVDVVEDIERLPQACAIGNRKSRMHHQQSSLVDELRDYLHATTRPRER